MRVAKNCDEMRRAWPSLETTDTAVSIWIVTHFFCDFAFITSQWI